jgi:hypothetical protein
LNPSSTIGSTNDPGVEGGGIVPVLSEVPVMVQTHLVVGSHAILVIVAVGDKRCECPLVDQNGVGLIMVPNDLDLREEIRDHSLDLLFGIQQLDPFIRSLRMSSQS